MRDWKLRIKTAHQIRHQAWLRKKHLQGSKLSSAHAIHHDAFKSRKIDEINTSDPSTFWDAKPLELTEALKRDGILTGVSPRSEPVSLTFVRFDPGIEATANSDGKPCEPAFLDALVTDCCVLIWKFRGLYRYTDFDTMEDPLPTDYADIFHDLDTVFDHCLRLKESPELFSTLVQEHQFMEKMSHIAEVIENLRNVILLKNESKLARNAMREKEKQLAKRLPFFHPGRADGKHPWSRWLENSSPVMPPGWLGIQQKIPHIGDNIIRRITTMYELYERQFRIEGLIDRKVNDTLEDFPAPGQAFEHMGYSKFATMAINYVDYKAGCRSETDKNGILRVEKLAKVVHHSFGQPENPVITGNANVPYHRFMMGYKIETLS
ncbi:hypothetical protein NHQ30_010499 [Ciborinia camelliae]|nr:hypothetical protein NHQ30_010499 [Ciborinia camelliae]